MRTVFKGWVGWRIKRALVLLLVMVGGILLTQACSGDGGSAETDRAAMVAFFHSTNGTVAEVVFLYIFNSVLHDQGEGSLTIKQWQSFRNEGDTLLDTWETLLENIDTFAEHLKGIIEIDGRGRITLLHIPFGDFQPKLKGEIPPELGNLSKLEVLNLHGSLPAGIPPELGNLSNLKELTLRGVIGGIPAELGNLSNLELLDISDAGLTGEIPAELGKLSNLRELDLNDNELTGEIPPELGRLGNLRELDLGYNGLSGEIPSELGNLSRLEVLNLHQTGLTGEIPSSLGNLFLLKQLYMVAGNEFTGCVPTGIGDVPSNDLPYSRKLPICEAP